MNQFNNVSPTSASNKKHKSRFSYLLNTITQEHKDKKSNIQQNKKGINHQVTQNNQCVFNFNLCTKQQDLCHRQLCKQKQILPGQSNEHSLRSQSSSSYLNHLPYRFQLKSINYQIFKTKIQPRSSLNSFIAYTPTKDEQNQFFVNINEISTIQNTSKTNIVQSNRNIDEIENNRRQINKRGQYFKETDQFGNQNQELILERNFQQVEEIRNFDKKQESQVKREKKQNDLNLEEQEQTLNNFMISKQFEINPKHLRSYTGNFQPVNHKIQQYIIEQRILNQQKTIKKSSKRKDDTTLDEKFIDYHIRNSSQKNQQRTILNKSQNDRISTNFISNKKQINANQNITSHYQTQNPKPKYKKYYLSKPIDTKTKQMSTKLQQSSYYNLQNSFQQTLNDYLLLQQTNLNSNSAHKQANHIKISQQHHKNNYLTTQSNKNPQKHLKKKINLTSSKMNLLHKNNCPTKNQQPNKQL